jgi:hypothetical protein
MRWKTHQHRLDPDRLVFIDETWVKTNMTRTCGWCQRGEPLIAKVPHGHWKTLTFLAGLRRDSQAISGAHHQSMEPSAPTRATKRPSPIAA